MASGDPGTEAPDDTVGGRTDQSRLTTPTFGTVVGGAMLGLEQALRSQPAPELMAAEHRPIRGLSGRDGEAIIVFPGDAPAEQDQDDPTG